MKSDPCRGDDRRSLRDAVTADAGIMSGIIFGRTSFDCYTLFDSMRPASYLSDFSPTRQRFENA